MQLSLDGATLSPFSFSSFPFPSLFYPSLSLMELFYLISILSAILALSLSYFFLFNKPKPSLDPKSFQPFPLISKKIVSPNTSIYRFALKSSKHVLGLPIGQHIAVQAHINGKNIQRSYTPITSDDDKGYFELLIKSYEQGNISKYISKMAIGDKLLVKGPSGQMKYTPHLCNEIGMIAGGTGITPMLQIIRAMVKNPLDTTKIYLIYANVNESDILLRSELETIAKEHPNRFTLYHCLNNPPEKWTQGVGFVSKEMIETHMPKPSPDIKILLCGPPPMLNAMKGHLAELNYEKPRTVSKIIDQVFCF